MPSLLVDSGYFMADGRNAHGELRPDAAAKNEWVAKAYDQFPVDVMNLSSRELKYFSRLFAKTEFDTRTASHPLLKRLVSANTVSDSQDIVSPQPFIIKEVPARQKSGAATTLRVAFIGLTETAPAPPRGFKFVDPVEAAKRILPQARNRADLVIALAFATADEATRIAREAPGIDAIIATNSQLGGAPFVPPITIGKTSIVFTALETRMLGELRFYRDAQGKFSAATRFIVLDVVVPDDPAAKQLVEAAAEAEKNVRSASKKLLEDWLARSRIRKNSRAASSGSTDETANRYVTSAACSQCHMDQYMKWTRSAHAHATNPLPVRQLEFEASCLDCHATGRQAMTVSGLTDLAGLQAVQCEQCHGPGAEHAAKPAKGYGRIANMKATCSVCHTSDTSPGFDLQAAWAKIKH